MKIAVLIGGFPAAGKTSISEKLGKEIPNSKNLDIDDFKRLFTDSKKVTEEIDSDEARMKYYNASVEKAIEILSSGTYIVIMEEVFHKKALRKSVEEKFDNAGIKVVWVYVFCERHVVKKRLKEKSRKGHILSTKESLKFYDLFKEIFEKMSGDVININNSFGSIEDNVSEIISNI